MRHNALWLCEVPKKNGAKQDWFLEFCKTAVVRRGDRRENFVQLWCGIERNPRPTNVSYKKQSLFKARSGILMNREFLTTNHLLNTVF